MPDLGILLLGAGVLLGTGFLLVRSLAGPSQPTYRDLYLEALEAWVAGDQVLADELFRELITNQPDSVAPYLQLGDLLRSMGQPGKAAILHRGLIARTGLAPSQQVQAGLSLSEDLLALGDHRGASQVLDSLVRKASKSSRYWWSRFRQWVSAGDPQEAVRALEHAATHVAPSRRELFRQNQGYFQLDRAYAKALTGDFSGAASLLKAIPSGCHAADQSPLVQAIIQVGKGDPNAAMETAAAGLKEQPSLQVAFQEYLRTYLLESGQFTRSIPLLERVCQGNEVPMSLVLELAMLYEKTGHRQQAINLLKSKQGRSDLTPNAVSGFLGLLLRDLGNEDLTGIWKSLNIPLAQSGWHCPACNFASPRLAWFCPECFGCQSFVRNVSPMGVDS